MIDNICDECGLKAKSTGHVLLDCAKAQEAWSCSKLVGLLDQFKCFSFIDLLWKMTIIDRVEEEKVARIVTIAWALWFNWNEIRLGGARKAGKAVVRWATQYLEEYWLAIEEEHPTPVVTKRVVSWLPP